MGVKQWIGMLKWDREPKGERGESNGSGEEYGCIAGAGNGRGEGC